MHKISLAPVLSATLSRDSCWITSTPASSRRASWPATFSCLLGLLEDLGHPPPLGGRGGPSLGEQHAVANATGVGLVVCLVLLGTADDLAVLGVLDPVLDLDHDGLVHLVAGHEALSDLAVTARRFPAGGGPRVLTHCPPPRRWCRRLRPQAPPRCRARARASRCRCGR